MVLGYGIEIKTSYSGTVVLRNGKAVKLATVVLGSGIEVKPTSLVLGNVIEVKPASATG